MKQIVEVISFHGEWKMTKPEKGGRFGGYIVIDREKQKSSTA
ncbi:MAG: hypothetical protein WCI64_04550 [Chlorobium sp.]